MADIPPRPGELGCASLLAVTAVGLFGMAAVTIGCHDPLLGIGLFATGGAGPATALATFGRRSRRMAIGATLWMLIALFALFGSAIDGGGGV